MNGMWLGGATLISVALGGLGIWWVLSKRAHLVSQHNTQLAAQNAQATAFNMQILDDAGIDDPMIRDWVREGTAQ